MKLCWEEDGARAANADVVAVVDEGASERAALGCLVMPVIIELLALHLFPAKAQPQLQSRTRTSCSSTLQQRPRSPDEDKSNCC